MSLPWWSSWSFSIIIYIIIIDLAAELQQWNQHVFLKFMLHSVFIFLSHVLIIIFSTASVLQVPYLMLLWQIWVLSGSNFFITCADNSFTAQKCNGESVIEAEEHRSQVIMTNEDSWWRWSWKARGERPGGKMLPCSWAIPVTWGEWRRDTKGRTDFSPGGTWISPLC